MPTAPRKHKPFKSSDSATRQAKAQARAAYESRHPERQDRLYKTAAWQSARAAAMAASPLCVECSRRGRVTAATDLDHIVPHRGDVALFWSTDNWQTLCKRCHAQKTRRGE